MQFTISGDVVPKLMSFRNMIEREAGSKVTWSYVLNRLFQCYVENKELKSKIASRESKIDEMHSKTEHYLELALQRPSAQPMMIGGTQQNAFIQHPPPLPPPPPKAPQLPQKVNVTMSADVKKDFAKEMSQVFTGGSEVLLKPSEIMKLCEPAHKDKEVKVIDIEPELKEHDKDFYKVKLNEESA